MEIPKPQITEYKLEEEVIENTFNYLIQDCARLGIKLNPVMGFVYLPNQEDTKNFKEVCRSIINSLKIT